MLSAFLSCFVKSGRHLGVFGQVPDKHLAVDRMHGIVKLENSVTKDGEECDREKWREQSLRT